MGDIFVLIHCGDIGNAAYPPHGREGIEKLLAEGTPH